MTQSDIFTQAWEQSRQAAFDFGGNSSEYFSQSLRNVYKNIKSTYKIESSNWFFGIANSYLLITSPTGNQIKLNKSIVNSQSNRRFVFEIAKSNFVQLNKEQANILLNISQTKF